jgi:hypothetical protein
MPIGRRIDYRKKAIWPFVPTHFVSTRLRLGVRFTCVTGQRMDLPIADRLYELDTLLIALRMSFRVEIRDYEARNPKDSFSIYVTTLHSIERPSRVDCGFGCRPDAKQIPETGLLQRINSMQTHAPGTPARISRTHLKIV